MRTPVAFTFANNGQEWQGGINYFRALFLALEATPACAIDPIALFGQGSDLAPYQLPANVRVQRHHVLDRLSLPWVLNKLSATLLGRPLLTNYLLSRQHVGVLSHGAPTGTRSIRNAAWIPDFQHIHLPQFFPAEELRKRDALYRKTIQKSDLVIVSSQSARNDLLAFCPEHGHKARVLCFAAIPPAIGSGPRLDLQTTYGLQKPFFYIPNQAWAHKNHLTAIAALAALKDRPDVLIVCSGSLQDHRSRDHVEALRREIERLGLNERFLLLGSIPYAHIAELMLQAVAVINPSLFEGWSTTVEESKALGVPLILSDLPVHREQCEGLAMNFFDPLNAEQLSHAMRATLNAPPVLDASQRLNDALRAHQQRMHRFAMDYAAIVQELSA